jgi:hypothetical protein
MSSREWWKQSRNCVNSDSGNDSNSISGVYLVDMDGDLSGELVQRVVEAVLQDPE